MCLKTFHSSSASLLETPSVCVWGTKLISCNKRSSLCCRGGSPLQFLTLKYADLKSNFLVILSLSTDTFVPCGLRGSHFTLPWTSACCSLYSRELQLPGCFYLGPQSCAEKVKKSPRGTARQEASVLMN